MKITGSLCRARHLAVPLAIALTFLSPEMASAAAGDLDPSFSGDGVRTVAFPDSYSYADEVAVQSDGGLVLLGTAHSSVGIESDFALVRLLAGGRLDPSFGDTGRVTTDFDGLYDEGSALALQDDGKIVAAGTSTGYPSIARYLPDGSLDDTFSRDGRLTLDIPGQARDLAIQPNGRIVAAIGDGQTFSAVRLSPRGRLDATFADGGVLREDFGLGGVSTRSVALDGTGILLGGSAYAANSTTQDDWGLARFDRRGNADTAFGEGGLTMTDFFSSGPDVLEDLVVQPDGMIVATGQSSEPPGSFDQLSDVTVARYDSGGVLDPGFGTHDGWERSDLGSVFDDGRSVALTADGSIVVASDVYADANAQAAAVRYTSQGVPDAAFGGGDGIAVADTPSTSDQGFSVAVRDDGRIVIAGLHSTFDQNTGSSFRFLVARFLG